MADLLRKGRALASKSNKRGAEEAAAGKGAASGGSPDRIPGERDGQAPGAAVDEDEGCPLSKGELGATTWGLVRRHCWAVWCQKRVVGRAC